MSSIEIVRVTGAALNDYINDLARLRIQVFKEFPYLYDGDLSYETQYLKTYQSCEQSVIVLALLRGKVVGASTGIPLKFETEEFKSPIAKAGYDLENFFYCAESVLQADYRGKGLGIRFFEEREAHAAQLGGFQYSCFCAVDRPKDHVLRPKNYKSLEHLWVKQGYQEHPQLKSHYSWKDLGDSQETVKPMTYWIKQLVGSD